MQKNEGKEKSKSFDLDDGAGVHSVLILNFQQQVILTALFQVSGSEQD